MSKDNYQLDDAGRAAAKAYVDEWTKVAFQTGVMSDDEKEMVKNAVEELYSVAGLTPPPRHRIVIAPSPVVARFAAAAAAAIWSQRSPETTSDAARSAIMRTIERIIKFIIKRDIKRDIKRNIKHTTVDATVAATVDATVDAAVDATAHAAVFATDLDIKRNIKTTPADNETAYATSNAIAFATADAATSATNDAIDAATIVDKIAAINYDTVPDIYEYGRWTIGLDGCVAAVKHIVGKFVLDHAANAHTFYQAGSSWAGWLCHVAFGRDYVKLAERGLVDPAVYEKYKPWETLGRLSGDRFVHKDFCIVSDRPVHLSVDEQNRPHNDTGPYVKWADGTAFYAVHGVHVPAWIIENPEQISTSKIDAEQNAEVRRVMLEKLGLENYIQETNARIVHEDLDGLGKPRRLLRREQVDDEPIVVVEVTNSTAEPDGTFRKYHLRVDPDAYGGRASRECQAAIASTWRKKSDPSMLAFKTPEEYRLTVET